MSIIDSCFSCFAPSNTVSQSSNSPPPLGRNIRITQCDSIPVSFDQPDGLLSYLIISKQPPATLPSFESLRQNSDNSISREEDLKTPSSSSTLKRTCSVMDSPHVIKKYFKQSGGKIKNNECCATQSAKDQIHSDCIIREYSEDINNIDEVAKANNMLAGENFCEVYGSRHLRLKRIPGIAAGSVAEAVSYDVPARFMARIMDLFQNGILCTSLSMGDFIYNERTSELQLTGLAWVIPVSGENKIKERIQAEINLFSNKFMDCGSEPTLLLRDFVKEFINLQCKLLQINYLEPFRIQILENAQLNEFRPLDGY